jgi:hypothetical protein
VSIARPPTSMKCRETPFRAHARVRRRVSVAEPKRRSGFTVTMSFNAPVRTNSSMMAPCGRDPRGSETDTPSSRNT